jgi:hypothetical protein
LFENCKKSLQFLMIVAVFAELLQKKGATLCTAYYLLGHVGA